MCSSHKLNLQVNNTVEQSNGLRTVICGVQRMMKITISRLRNENTLRNLGELPTIIKNERRKYGKYEMQKRFGQIKYE